MIETAMFGNSRTIRMNGSFEMRNAMTRSLARTVATRGTLPNMPISPTISLAPSVATTTGPPGVSRMTSARPSMIRYAASAWSPCRIRFLPGSNPTRSLINASSFSFEGSISAKNGTRRSSSNSCLRLISSLLGLVLPLVPSFGGDQQGHQRATTLLLQLAAAQDESAIEIPRKARPVQHPDDPSAGKFLSQPIGDLGLVLAV